MIVTLEHMSSMCVTSSQTIGLDYVSENSLGVGERSTIYLCIKN